jgi:hypothetical protein
MSYDPAVFAASFFPQVFRRGNYNGQDMVVYTQGCLILNGADQTVLDYSPPSKQLRQIKYSGTRNITVIPWSTTFIQNAQGQLGASASFFRFWDEYAEGAGGSLNVWPQPANLVYTVPVNGQPVLIEDKSLETPHEQALAAIVTSLALPAGITPVWTTGVAGIKYVRVRMIVPTNNVAGIIFNLRFFSGADLMMKNALLIGFGFSFLGTAGYALNYIAQLPADLTTVDVQMLVNATSAQIWIEGYSDTAFSTLNMSEMSRSEAVNPSENQNPNFQSSSERGTVPKLASFFDH